MRFKRFRPVGGENGASRKGEARSQRVDRVTKEHPCPVCGGWHSLPRGTGRRCHGFLSKDGAYAHCTREEYAGNIEMNPTTETFAHILRGYHCNCGARHDQHQGKEKMGKIVAEYPYRNAQARELFQLVRKESKEFLQRRRGSDGKWIWNLDGVEERPLYNYPELLDADPDRWVYVVEGEKDADNLTELGLLATTNSGGAGKWRDEYSETLRGRKVAILQDNDQAGRGHAQHVAESLSRTAKRVKVIELPDLPEHGDVTDWLDAGGNRPQLRKLVKKATDFTPAETSGGAIRFRTPAEMSWEQPTEMDWIVKGVIAAGAITEQTGKVKSAGKTTLSTHLCSAVIRGERFLGLKTSRTPVVYLSEQPWNSFREALKRAGLSDQKDDFALLLWREVIGKPWPEIVKAALEECNTRGARLLVIDTLPPFAGLTGATENDSGSALAVMKPLQDVAAAGIGILVVRHERKGGGEVGESGRGSTAFSGAADILLTLSRPKGRGATLRELHALSRFDETPESMLIELTPKGYVSHGRVRPIAEEEARNAIEETLPRSKSEAMTMTELMATAEKSRVTLQRALEILEEKGVVRKTGKGVKNAPHRYWLVEQEEGEKGKEHKVGKGTRKCD